MVKTDYSYQMQIIREQIYKDMVEIKESLRFFENLHKRGKYLEAGYVSMEIFERHISDLQETYNKYVKAYNAMS